MEEKPKKKKLKSSVISGTPKIEVHTPYDVLPDDVPEKTNEMVAIEKLLKENIAFCVENDFITIEGRNNIFVYYPEFDTWAMKTSRKTGEGIDSLIGLLLRR